MRHGTSNRRSRGRGGGSRRGGQPRSKVYDSNGPEVRIRGTAHQVAEKYLTLAKDAASTGELILAESYLQHAEHYQRVINSWDKSDGDQSQAPAPNQSQSEPQKKTYRKKQNSEDDLALPASILGGDVEEKSKEEKADAVE